jgi:hypothetical protein
MDHAGDARAMDFAELRYRLRDRIVFCEIDRNQRKIRLAAFLIQSNNGVDIIQRRRQRAADIAGSTGVRTIGFSVLLIDRPLFSPMNARAAEPILTPLTRNSPSPAGRCPICPKSEI